MKKDKYDDIKKKIAEETGERPDSLSRESMVSLIKSKGIAPEKKPRRLLPLTRVASAAAALVVLVAAFALYQGTGMAGTVNKAGEGTTTTTAEAVQTTDNSAAKSLDTKLTGADNYSEIEKYFLSLQSERVSSKSQDDGFFYSNTASPTFAAAAPQDAADAAAESYNESASAAAAGESHGKTNTQVDGVDEADIIKNDGKYLYTVTDGMTLSIVDAKSLSLLSRIKLETGEDDRHLNISNIYLNGDTLVAVCAVNDFYNTMPLLDGVYCCCDYVGGDTKTVSVIFDISDRSSPRELRRFTQDGYQTSSRMVGSVLYNVSRYDVNVYQDEEKLKDECIPSVDGESVPSGSIYWKGGASGSSYIILTAFDTAAPDGKVEILSVLGGASNVYCTKSSMYVFTGVYEENFSGTRIYAFSIDGTKLTYRASGEVPGNVINQYSLDEYNGFLRVATTAYDYKTYVNVSSVYVLDSSMKQAGVVKNLAHNEAIQSVRFMGDTAYVVTFLNTDPLFVIDLSDPAAPRVVGEVKLPGFSAYLHPVGEGLILGVGYDGDDQSANFSTVKVSLFDVRNPAKPAEIDNYIVECASTDITRDPKAFLFYPEMSLAGIPMVVTKENGENPVQSYMTLKVSQSGLELLSGFVHASGYDVYSCQYFRGTYIGDVIYTLTQGLIKSHSLKSFENTGSLELEGFAQKYTDDDLTFRTY